MAKSNISSDGICGEGRWVANLVARLGSNPEISQKIRNWRHKQKSGQHTLAQQKNTEKSIFYHWVIN
jgi:hypothetical protein